MGHQTQANKELRYASHPEAEIRMVGEGESRTIRGYGVVFNKESRTLYANGRPFREVVKPESVAGVSLDSLLSMHNHRSERLLGATHSKTMRVGVDSVGVWYEVDLPDSPTGNDVLQSVKRGDTRDSSFQFTTSDGGDSWEMRDGTMYRQIKQFSGIYEMGPVSEGAYGDTTVNVRSMPDSIPDNTPEPRNNETELFQARVQFLNALYNH